MIKEKVTLKQKLAVLNKATESFRVTKKRYISKICSVGVKHRWLKYPSLIAAVLFIFFANAAFYVSLWVILNKRRAVGVFIVLIAVIGLAVLYGDYLSADSFYKQTEETYVIYMNSSDAITFPDGDELKDNSSNRTELKPVKWQDIVEVDFDGLKSINKDIVGWIYFENVAISYPILQGRTDDDYIRTTYTGESSRDGSIFLESMNSPDFSDFHTIIYGHNMRNLSMFGKLRYYYREKGYYNDHKYFQIIMPDKKYRYEIIAYKHVEENDAIYKVTGINGANDFAHSAIMNGSMTGMNVQVSENDHIVTLSTCTSGDNRFVVSALRVDEE